MPPARRVWNRPEFIYQLVTTAVSDDAWIAKYLQPSSRLFQLATAPPGNLTIWTVQDVWQVCGWGVRVCVRVCVCVGVCVCGWVGGGARARARARACVRACTCAATPSPARATWSSARPFLSPQSRTPLTDTPSIWSPVCHNHPLVQCAYPVISLVAENPPWWMPAANQAGVQYLYNLIKPGGRL